MATIKKLQSNTTPPAHLKRYAKHRVYIVTDANDHAIRDAEGNYQFEKETDKPQSITEMEPRFAEELNKQSHNSLFRYYETEEQ